jgi:hypothetical protein
VEREKNKRRRDRKGDSELEGEKERRTGGEEGKGKRGEEEDKRE